MNTEVFRTMAKKTRRSSNTGDRLFGVLLLIVIVLLLFTAWLLPPSETEQSAQLAIALMRRSVHAVPAVLDGRHVMRLHLPANLAYSKMEQPLLLTGFDATKPSNASTGPTGKVQGNRALLFSPRSSSSATTPIEAGGEGAGAAVVPAFLFSLVLVIFGMAVGVKLGQRAMMWEEQQPKQSRRMLSRGDDGLNSFVISYTSSGESTNGGSFTSDWPSDFFEKYDV